MRLATTIEGNNLMLHLDAPSGADLRGFLHAFRFLFGEPLETRVVGNGLAAPLEKMGQQLLYLEGGSTIRPNAVQVLTFTLANGTRVKFLELSALVDEALGGDVMTKEEVLASIANNLLAERITEEQHDALVKKVEAFEE